MSVQELAKPDAVKKKQVGYSIRPGYKQTAVGLIPADWEVRPLVEIVTIQSGIAKNSKAVISDPVDIFYLRVANVQDGFLDLTEMSRIRITRNDVKRYEVLSGDMLMNEGGDLDQLGRGALWRGEYSPCVHQNHVFVVRCGKFVIPDYLNAWTGATPARQYFLVAGKQTTNLASINKTALGQLSVALPPVAEQETIADALGDADAFIESLEQLLAKKRSLKQAAMQQLLTGKKRLPGFDGEWLRKQIGSEIDLLTGFPFPSNSYADSGVRLLRGSNIKRGVTDWREDITQFWPAITTDIKRYELRAGDIVIAMDGSLVGRSFAQLTDFDLPALLLQRVARIRSEAIDSSYLKAQICSPLFTRYCDLVKTVTAIPHISPKDIREYEIWIPPTLSEQTVIATVLSDMDAEITAIEAKIDKARQIKAGMMQELLTGKTRLV